MKIIVKAKSPIKEIERSDFLEMQQLFVRMMRKYDIQVEIRNFHVVEKRKIE